MTSTLFAIPLRMLVVAATLPMPPALGAPLSPSAPLPGYDGATVGSGAVTTPASSPLRHAQHIEIVR
jgi:hypothetical protein